MMGVVGTVLLRKKMKPYVIRFRNPLDGEVEFHDLVRGLIYIQNSELDDVIIARTDGTPTYNFTVVVDDADMKMFSCYARRRSYSKYS